MSENTTDQFDDASNEWYSVLEENPASATGRVFASLSEKLSPGQLLLWTTRDDLERAKRCVAACGGMDDPAAGIAELKEAVRVRWGWCRAR